MSTSDLESPCCPVCGSAEHAATRFSDPPFAVVRCRHCAVYYASPRLREEAMLSAYRSEAYFEGDGSGYSGYAAQQRSLVATFQRFVRELETRGMAGGALLDVGCGYGYMLEAAAGRFDVRDGTDFSPAAVEQARTRGDTIWLGGTDALPQHRMYDCITALQVIEHVYAPCGFVRELFGRLRPGGWLVVATPDIGSGWARVFGSRWPSLKLPEHVVFYDARSLTALLGSVEGAGRTVRIPFPHAFPLSEVLAKLGLPAPRSIGGTNVWLPATTVCVAVQRTY